MSLFPHPRRRRGNPACALLAGIAITTIATGARAEDARINEAVFDAQSAFFAGIVEVRPEGDKWGAIVPGSVGFDARIKIDTKMPGYVERVGVWLGQCVGNDCGNFHQILYETPMARDYEVNRSLSFPAEDLGKARAGATTYGTMIVNGCNTKPVTEPHSFQLTVDASMSANTRKARGLEKMDPVEVGTPFDGGDVTRHDTFQITVNCLATRNNDTVERKPDPHRTKPEIVDAIDLSLSTYHSTQSGPRGTTCKPLKVTTRIETGEAGPMNVKLWRQVNGGPITSEQKQLDAEAIGGGKFGDTWNKFEHFTKTTTVQYKAEMLGGTFAPSTGWKSITIHCNGDYAPPPSSSTNPDDDLPPAGQPQGRPTAELPPVPPVIVTPPPTACATGKAAKRGASAPCIKTAPLPDKRKAAAEAKRKAAQDAARKAAERRKAQQENELRRRNAEFEAELEAQREIVSPRRPLMVRPGGFGRLTPNPPPQRRLGVSVQPMFLR